MVVGENNLRPHLIHFNRCENVSLDAFKIRESPFWTIHIYGIAKNLNVAAEGHNNDGIDLEMTQNFLVEDCTFKEGDDAVVIKAGCNQHAWRLNTPSQNSVVQNCNVLKGHIFVRDINIKSANNIFDLKGEKRLPIKNVSLKNVHVNPIKDFVKKHTM